MNREKLIGILGGMGPEATVELFRRIVARTPARRDQDHVRVIIDSNSKIPDRGSYVFDQRAEDPRPALRETARNLERAGADLITMPCNTVHYYLPEIRRAVRIPVIDMIRETATILNESPVGLLGTDTTTKMGLYHKAAYERGIDILVPKPDDQRIVMRDIFAIKAGRNDSLIKQELLDVAHRLQEQGARAMIVGCTEISLAISQADLNIPVYDALDVLAEAALREARTSERMTEPVAVATTTPRLAWAPTPAA
ncbi:amino acid racemase [Candidatus Acetothermia bacterium]|nr:amino acid racemase [Candidatus Acetothermia bacterium]